MASVPVVGNVTFVAAVWVNVNANAPEVVRLPPSVIVLEPLLTPVPPYAPVIMLPFHVEPDPSVLLVNVSDPASVASVPVVGNVTFVAAVVVNVRAYAPLVARVLPFAIVNVPVEEETVNPLYVLFVRFCVPVNVATVLSIATVFPVIEIPVPAASCPAPENCVKVSAVVPTVTVPFVVNTQPLLSFAVPSSTKAKAPGVIFAAELKSDARDHAPAATT